jgi:hypothetical protein
MPKQREIKQELTFYEKGTSQSYYAAERWLCQSGFDTGSLDAPHNPVAFVKGDYDLPQKWHNLKPKHKALIDGIMTSTDWREGEVKVIIYK